MKVGDKRPFVEVSGGPAAGGASKPAAVSARVKLVGGQNKGQMAAFRRQEEFCDVQIKLGAQLFPAHRVVLAAESKFLAALFRNGFKDSSTPVVELKEVTPEVFELVLAFIYEGKCAVPDWSWLEPVLAAALRLQVDALETSARKALEKGLTPENCIATLACADRHQQPALASQAQALAKKHFASIASDPALPASNLLALLAADDLDVESEQAVFGAVVAWLKGQEESMSDEEQLRMFALVRFPLMSQDFIETLAEQAPVLSTQRGCKLLLCQFQGAFFGGKPTAREVKEEEEEEELFKKATPVRATPERPRGAWWAPGRLLER